MIALIKCDMTAQPFILIQMAVICGSAILPGAGRINVVFTSLQLLCAVIHIHNLIWN